MNNHEYGTQGEHQAAEFLAQHGFSIIAQNYRYGSYGEIDIIAIKDTVILFVEVKRRHNIHFGSPLYAITSKKLTSLKKVALYFLQQNPQYNSTKYTLRFDCIIIIGSHIEWIQDIAR